MINATADRLVLERALISALQEKHALLGELQNANAQILALNQTIIEQAKKDEPDAAPA